MNKPQVTIYTDGGCSPNPGAGGWAFILLARGKRKAHSGNCRETTNNRMELTAVIEALRALKMPCQVTVYTDSEYVKRGITEWVQGWIKRGWRTASKKPVKNRDLWEALLAETPNHEITWEWVRGHDGNEYNERVDQMATEAREALVE